MMDNSDYTLAVQLQEEFDREIAFQPHHDDKKNRNTGDSVASSSRRCAVQDDDISLHRVVDDALELSDPTPDIHALFLQFDRLYFRSRLANVEVRWSPRMTLCAGLCCYEGHGGLCSIRLSKPLLALRPRKDLVQTLLHEMIHAYLFVTNNNKDHDGHGPEFLEHMNRINKISGANVTIYHSFHDEVNSFRTHWWQCDGPCRQRSPYHGLVKRSMNRPPGPRDTWWDQHRSTCGGVFTKTKEPDAVKPGKRTKKKDLPAGKQTKTEPSRDIFVPFSGIGNRLVKEDGSPNIPRQRRTIDSYFGKTPPGAVQDVVKKFVSCPICGERVSNDVINGHLDNCLGS